MTSVPVDPVERFLGREASEGGPFALLGIPATRATPDVILKATDARMRLIDRHPDNTTPDADEVRLAVHAAAAKLLDASARQVLFSPGREAKAAGPRSTGAGPSVSAEFAAPVHLPPPVPQRLFVRPDGDVARRPVIDRSGPIPPAPAGSLRSAIGVLAFRRELAAAIALSGGWNTRSRRRLLLISARRGISVRALAIAARATGTRPSEPAGPRGTVSAPVPVVNPRFSSSPIVPSAAGPSLPPLEPPGALREVPPESSRSQQPGGAPPVGFVLGERRAEPDPAGTVVRWILGLVGVAFVGAIGLLIFIGVRTLATPRGADGFADGAPTPSEAMPSEPRAPAMHPTEAFVENADAGARDLENPDAVLREIRAAANQLPTRPAEARARFHRAVSAAARFWPRYGPDRLAAVRGAVVDYAYAAEVASAEDALATVRTLASPLASAPSPGDSAAIAPAAWATGMLTALRRERELPESMVRAIDRALLSGFGAAASTAATFEGGGGAALRKIGEELARANVADEFWLDSWRAWADAVDAVGRGDRALLAALQTHGLGALLSQGPSPTARPAADEAIAMLATRTAWRADDGSRSWLLDTLVSQDASVAALASLTRAVAERSGAEGVDPSMVLSADATMLRRRELRDEYASRWGLFSVTMSEGVIGAWTEAARVWLSDQNEPAWDAGTLADDIAAGARAVVFARLNAAAAAAWRGDESATYDVLDGLDAGVAAILSSYESGTTDWDDQPAFTETGDWAQRYLLADRNVSRRLELLRGLAGGRRLGAVDAEVLMGEAMLGQPERVRIEAAEVVVSLAGSQPAVVNAAIEWLPRAPRSRRVAEMLSDLTLTALPAHEDPAFRVAARRALVERLLELVTSSGPLGAIDGFGLLISEAYTESVGTASPPTRLDAAARVLSERRAGLAARTLPFADAGFSVRSIEARRTARLRIARGPTQVFAAEQVTLAEITAAVVRAERPSTESRVVGVLERLAERRRAAAHILEQISATEAAMTELWILRFGAEP